MLNPLFHLSSRHCTLLIAPPAWGKTRELVRVMQDVKALWLIIVPLRALADEIYENLLKQNCLVYPEKDYILWCQSKNGCLVTTPERFLSVSEKLTPCWWSAKKPRIVLDEFHLYFQWRDFRPVMWEVLSIVFYYGFHVMGLTATLTPKELCEFTQLASLNFSTVLKIDQGNMSLKYLPARHRIVSPFFHPFIGFILKFYIWMTKLRRRRLMIFVPYRHWVDLVVNYCQFIGVSCLGCKGGQAQIFRNQLQQNPSTMVIVATKVLSHGVNLPSFHTVFIAYTETDPSFFIQMVARGGRKGEHYQLVSFKPPVKLESKL